MIEIIFFMFLGFLGFNDWNKIRLVSVFESDRDQYNRNRLDYFEYYV